MPTVYPPARAFTRKYKKISIAIGLVIFSCLFWIWFLSAPLRGDLSARVDIHRGKYRLLAYGLPPAGTPEYAECLRRRYGVEFHAVAGCTVSRGLIAYVDAYDRFASAAVNSKFGHDIFKECAQVAYRQ